MLLAYVVALLNFMMPQASVGQALIDESAAKLKSTQSVALTMTVSVAGRTMKMPTKILRGGFVRTLTDGNEQIVTPTGGWTLNAAQKQYARQDASEAARQASNALPGFEQLAGAKPLQALDGPMPAKLGDKATVRISVKSPPSSGLPAEAKCYLHFDPALKLPVGVEATAGGQSFTLAYEDLRLDAGLTPKDFEWTPPPGWTALQPPTQTDMTASLLKLGSIAPKFKLNTPKGGKMSLASASAGKKAALVNFWFYG